MRIILALAMLFTGIVLASPVMTIFEDLVTASDSISVISGWPRLVLDAFPFLYFLAIGFIVFKTLKGKGDAE